MEPLVSVIVPVYNAQATLERCVDSVLAQEYTNLELLLVDDGSTDGSAALCDQYGARDKRVRVIHKENGGVSHSRNLALELVAGEYVQFLDSDDWLTTDATRQFVRSAQTSGCDMVIADFYRVVGEKLSHKGDIEKEGLLTRQEFANFMMEDPADFYYGVLWNKLYRRGIIAKHGLRMDEDISWCEDFIFNLEYIRHCHTIYVLQVPVYYYVKTKGSLVNSQGANINNTIRMKLNVFEYYHKFYREVYGEESYEDIRLQLYRFFVTYAKDGFVPPAPLSGSRKLGQERQSVPIPEAVEGDGIALEYYRYRKLWGRYCETVAIKNDMSLQEVEVLLYLNQGVSVRGLRELSDLSGLTKRAVGTALQKLEKREMVRRLPWREEQEKQEKITKQEKTAKKERTTKQKKAAKREQEKAARQNRTAGRKGLIKVLPAASPVFRDLELAREDFLEAQYKGLQEVEKAHLRELLGKVSENVKHVLRG